MTIKYKHLLVCYHANCFYDIWRHIELSAAILNYPAEMFLIKTMIF